MGRRANSQAARPPPVSDCAAHVWLATTRYRSQPHAVVAPSVREIGLSMRGLRVGLTTMAERSVDPAVSPTGTGCVECLATGGWWFHLRRCALCGHIGC